MNPEQFRAAVETIIGVPASSDHAWFWQLDTPHDGLHIRLPGTKTPDLYFGKTADSEFDLLMGFDDGFSPGLGENPLTGRWHIRARDFNNDPEAVLRELARRLAKAGYEPPRIAIDYETASQTHVAAGTPVAGSLTLNLPDPDEGFRWVMEGTMVFQKPLAGSKPDVPVSGCVISLTEEERGHLEALMETAIEPPENRPPGFVGSVWQGQQDAWASILKKLQP